MPQCFKCAVHCVAFAIGATTALLPAFAATQLTGSQLIETHSGKCIDYVGPDSRGVQCFMADGTTVYDDKVYGKDTGRWSVRGDEMCESWSQDPGLSCGPVAKIDDKTFTDGEYTWTIR